MYEVTQQLDFNLTPRSFVCEVIKHPLFMMLRIHIVKKFWLYHQENPHIFSLFQRYALELKRAGRMNYGSKAIIERIRWHVSVETRGEDFKMANNHTSCYSRLLVATNPEYADFFKFRHSPGTVPISAESITGQN